MNALLYIRVSSEEQVKFGYSIDAQLNDLKQYCNDNNIHIKNIYKDEGISGATVTKRKAFQKMISDATNGDIILFTKLDRFSRNLLDANIVVQELDKKNVSIKAIFEDDIDTSSADGKFIFNLKLSLAQREREKTSERILDVNRYRRSIGKVTSGSCPLGYKIVNKRLVIDESTKEYVLFIFNKFNECGSLNETYRQFNERYGRMRTIKTFRNIMTNEIYIGKSHGNDKYCEPLVSKELFKKVNDRLSRNIRKPRTNNIYLFSRLIVCPICGRKLYAHGYTNNTKNTYYHCSSRSLIEHKASCHFTHCREDRIESQLLDKIEIFASNKKRQFRKKSSRSDYTKKINSAKNKIERLKELYIDGDIDKTSYKAKLSDLTALLNEYEQLNQQQENDSINQILSLNIREIYDSLTKENKMKFWNNFIKEIIVDTDGNVIDVIFS